MYGSMFGNWKIALIMALVLNSTATLATLNLTVSSAVGLPGDTIVINVDYTGNGTIVALQLDILFNPAVLTPLAAISGSAAPHGLLSNVVGPGKMRLLIPPVLQSPLPHIATSHPLASIPFVIASNAPQGSTALSVSNVILADANGIPVAVNMLSDGEITILESGIIPEAGLLYDVPTLSFWRLALLVLVLTWFGVLAMRHKTNST